MDALRAIAATLWIGGMWVIGLIVTPTLFANLDKAVAGAVAGKLFAAIAWVGLVCGVLLLIGAVGKHGVRAVKTGYFWLIVGMLACTLINQFAVSPMIAHLKLSMNHAAEGMFGGGFATWHAISSLIYLLQSLMALVWVWRGDK